MFEIPQALAAQIALLGAHPLLLARPAHESAYGAPSARQSEPAALALQLPQLTAETWAALAFAHGSSGLNHPPRVAPFRAPHHTIGKSSMFGCDTRAAGEVHLAHGGILFLDEYNRFSEDCQTGVFADCSDYARQLLAKFRLCARTYGPSPAEAFCPDRFVIVHRPSSAMDDPEGLAAALGALLDKHFTFVAEWGAVEERRVLDGWSQDRAETVRAVAVTIMRIISAVGSREVGNSGHRLLEMVHGEQLDFATRLAQALVPVPF